MTRRRAPRRAQAALGLALCALAGLGAVPLEAQTADPTACTPRFGETNTWDQIGAPVLVDSASNQSPDRWPEALRSSVDPERPCLVYRVVGDPRAVERSTDGGTTFRRVFLDERTSSSGAPARLTGVYTPAPRVVYLSEAGNGTAVIKSTDAGTTWRPANGGLAGQAVGRLAVSPSNPDVVYAAAETAFSADGLGTVLNIYVTRNGGTTWTELFDNRLLQGRPFRQGYSLAVDPGDPGHLMVSIQGVSAVTAGTPEPGSVLLESEDFGARVTPGRAEADVAEVVFSRRGGNALRLYALANGSNNTTNGIIYSDDAAGHWRSNTFTKVVVGVEARWHGGLVDPVTPDKMLYFGSPKGGSSALLALYTRNGFKDQELGEQPGLSRLNYSITQYRTDRFGQFYIDVGLECRVYACPPGAKTDDLDYSTAWSTIRFRPPDPGQAYKLSTEKQVDAVRGGTFASVPSARCTIEPQAPLHAADRVDDAGSLAFDGTRLYYTRRAEQGPDPYAAVIRVADPASCKETGRFVVHFDRAVYEDARQRAVSDANGSRLLPERPSIDSLAYDALHDELWFSLTRTGPYTDPYNGDPDGSPFPVWAVRRGGEGADRQAELRYWANPCGLGGVGLMAHDRARDTLWTCHRKVPGERARTGKPFVTCLHPMFQGRVAGGAEVWDVRAWGVGRPGTLLAVKDDSESLPPRKVEQYDARTCTHTDEWSLPPTDSVPEPDQGPTYVSSQLVCDPVTFRDRLAGAPAPAAVAWLREGKVFTPYRVTAVTDGPGLTCPWPTVLTYSGATGVEAGKRLAACLTVSVPGSGGTVPGVPVRISVAGAPAAVAVSDAQGRACAPYDVPGQSLQGSRLAVKGWVVEDAHLLASAAEASVLVGTVPVPPPAPVVLPPPDPPAPPPIPLLPALVPAPAPQPGVQPAVTPPGQAVAQQGFASEKEREVQLAHAQQEESQGQDVASAPAVADGGADYEFTFAVVAVLALGSMALGRALRPSSSPALALAYARNRRRRTRR